MYNDWCDPVTKPMKREASIDDLVDAIVDMEWLARFDADQPVVQQDPDAERRDDEERRQRLARLALLDEQCLADTKSGPLVHTHQHTHKIYDRYPRIADHCHAHAHPQGSFAWSSDHYHEHSAETLSAAPLRYRL